MNPPIWIEALAFFQENAPHLKPELLHEGFSQTRLKAKLAVRPGPEIGLFRRGTHEAISIPECLVHHPAINRAVLAIKEEIISHKLPLFQEKPPSGHLRYLQLFVERKTEQIQLVLTLNLNENCAEIDRFCKSLLKKDLWHSIWLNFHPALSNRILGDGWERIHGEPFLWQTFNGTEVAFHPGAFSQAHLSLFEKMLQKIDHWVEPGAKILELYAGVGVIGLSLHNKISQIDLVENNPYAKLSFQESLLRLPKPTQDLYTYHSLDAKESPRFIEENSIIIADPPRKGLDEAVLTRLCDLKNAKLIYVSCGFESFQRDCWALLDAGWKFIDVSGYLLFPGTNHVEILALLEAPQGDL
ncbi:MAG: hypothetical protein V4487_09250 [Chlamydiota bacterium]